MPGSTPIQKVLQQCVHAFVCPPRWLTLPLGTMRVARPALPQVMLDFHVCSWSSQPQLSNQDDSLARHFDALNEEAGFSATLQASPAAQAPAEPQPNFQPPASFPACPAVLSTFQPARTHAHLPAAHRGGNSGGRRGAASHHLLLPLPATPGPAAGKAHAVSCCEGSTPMQQQRTSISLPVHGLISLLCLDRCLTILMQSMAEMLPPTHPPAGTTPSWPRQLAATGWSAAFDACAPRRTSLGTRARRRRRGRGRGRGRCLHARYCALPEQYDFSLPPSNPPSIFLQSTLQAFQLGRRD